MKNNFTYIALLIIVFAFNNSCGQDEKPIKLVKPNDFASLMKSDNTVLLDVRTPEEYDSGAIAKSVNIDFYANDFSDKLSQLDKNKTYLVYCRSGKRSNKAANMLVEKGFKHVVDLEGGIKAWEAEGLPLNK